VAFEKKSKEDRRGGDEIRLREVLRINTPSLVIGGLSPTGMADC
jgi:hypothetical protein